MASRAFPVRAYAVAASQARRSRQLTQSLWVVLCAAALTAGGMLHPDPRGVGTHEQLGLPPCGFYVLTGVPCPGCGMTTAFAYAVRLKFAHAFMANPFGMLVCTTTAVFGAFSLVCLVTDWRAWQWVYRLGSTVVLWVIFGSLAASWGFKILATLRGWWPPS